MSVLKTGLEERRVEVKSSFLSSNVEFSIDACDTHGRYTMHFLLLFIVTVIITCTQIQLVHRYLPLVTTGPWIHVPRYSFSLDTCP